MFARFQQKVHRFPLQLTFPHLPVEISVWRTGARTTTPFGFQQRRTRSSSTSRMFRNLPSSVHFPNATGFTTRAPFPPITYSTVSGRTWNTKNSPIKQNRQTGWKMVWYRNAAVCCQTFGNSLLRLVKFGWVVNFTIRPYERTRRISHTERLFKFTRGKHFNLIFWIPTRHNRKI